MVGQLRDMNQTVLMHTNIDERTEMSNVGDHSFQPHPCRQIADLIDAFGERGHFKFVPRVSTR